MLIANMLVLECAGGLDLAVGPGLARWKLGGAIGMLRGKLESQARHRGGAARSVRLSYPRLCCTAGTRRR